jgi:hypothetical protein
MHIDRGSLDVLCGTMSPIHVGAKILLTSAVGVGYRQRDDGNRGCQKAVDHHVGVSADGGSKVGVHRSSKAIVMPLFFRDLSTAEVLCRHHTARRQYAQEFVKVRVLLTYSQVQGICKCLNKVDMSSTTHDFRTMSLLIFTLEEVMSRSTPTALAADNRLVNCSLEGG